jgi:hypothetical protein
LNASLWRKNVEGKEIINEVLEKAFGKRAEDIANLVSLL